MNGLAPLVDGCELAPDLAPDLAPVLAPDLAPDLAPVLAGGGCDLGAGWDLAGVGCCCDLLVLQKEVRLVLVDNIKILTNALVN